MAGICHALFVASGYSTGLPEHDEPGHSPFLAAGADEEGYAEVLAIGEVLCYVVRCGLPARFAVLFAGGSPIEPIDSCEPSANMRSLICPNDKLRIQNDK